MAAASSSSMSAYSNLLRRSKVASYDAAIDQVLTASAAHRSRGDYGLKRPLMKSKNAVSPFVKVNELDRDGRRTHYRQATKETTYVKKWSELTSAQLKSNDPLQSSTASALSGSTASSLDGSAQIIRSRYIDEQVEFDAKGRLVPDPVTAFRRPINILAMPDDEFERLTDYLKEIRPDFEAFIKRKMFPDDAAETEDQAPGETDEEFELRGGLLGAAQAPPTIRDRDRLDIDLLKAIEEFMNREFESTAARPAPHPTLALRYAPVTPLESSLEPPAPGRLLGPRSSGTMAPHLVSVIGHLSAIPRPAAVQPTKLLPDAEGQRTNIPGRSSWRVDAKVNPTYWSMTTEDELTTSGEPPVHEPKLLAHMPVTMQVKLAVHEPVRPLVGSAEYVGREPAQARSTSTTRYSDVFKTSSLSLFNKDKKPPAPLSSAQQAKRQETLVEQRRNDPMYAPRPTSSPRSSLQEALRKLLDDQKASR